MRAFLAAITAGLVALLVLGSASVLAGVISESVTPTVSSTPIVESTLDPCAESPVDLAGEEGSVCITETPTSTIDPCVGGSGEGDGCESPTATVTEIIMPVVPTATMTATLEYEIDVPVSFFPTETVEGGVQETVAAATETDEDDLDGVTGLPNAGGAGPKSSGSGDWMLVIAMIIAIGSLGLTLRANRHAQR